MATYPRAVISFAKAGYSFTTKLNNGVHFPFGGALHQNESVLLHPFRSGWRVNRSDINEPRPVHLGGQPACLDRRIAIGPFLCLLCRVSLKDKDPTQRGVIHEGSRDHQLVFIGQPADICHMLFLKFVSRVFAQLGCIRGASQKNEKISDGLCFRLHPALLEGKT